MTITKRHIIRPRVGEVIKKKYITNDGKFQTCNKELTVIEHYTHHILCEDNRGIKESINNGELIMMGLAYNG